MNDRLVLIVLNKFPSTGTRREVLLTLASLADEGDCVAVSFRVLAHSSGRSLATTKRAIRDLCEDGWVVVVRAGARNGIPNYYEIRRAKLMQEAGFTLGLKSTESEACLGDGNESCSTEEESPKGGPCTGTLGLHGEIRDGAGKASGSLQTMRVAAVPGTSLPTL